MTDQTTVMPGLKKCGKCDTWQPPSAFSAQTNSADGLQAWCKKCHKDYKATPATKGMDVPDERREWLALDPLAKKKVIDAAWTHTAMALVKMVAVATDRQKELAKQRERLSAEARANTLADRIVKALAERTLLKARAKREKAERRITKAKQEIRDNQQRRDELTARVTHATDELAVQIEDLSRRITVVKSNLDAGTRAIELQRVRNWAADRDRAERDSAEWVFKANTTTDHGLRGAYLARAAGENLDDDDD